MSAVSAAAPTTQDAERRRRLAEQVRARRLELGISVRAAATQAGVARDTWIGLEEATRRTAETSYAAIEKTLQWETGSISAVLAGGEPTPVTEDPPGPAMQLKTTGSMRLSTPIRPISEHPGDAALIRVMNNPDLTNAEKAKIVRAVISEQERFAERRAAELIEQALGERP